MDIRKKQKAIIDALEDVKGKEIVAFDVSHLTPEFDRVVIATGDSTRQVKSLARSVHDRMREMGERVHGMEGEQEGEWVLVDTGDVVVHVMHPAIRKYYNLEELWGHKPIADHVEPAGPTRKRTGAKKAAAKTGVASAASKAARKTPSKAAPARAATGTAGAAARKRPAREGAAGAYAASAAPARKTPARTAAPGTATRTSPARKSPARKTAPRKTAPRKTAPRKSASSRGAA